MNLVTRSANKLSLMVAALAVALVASVPAFAAPPVPSATAVVDYIELLFVPIAAVGAAVLLLILGIKAYKWMRRAI